LTKGCIATAHGRYSLYFTRHHFAFKIAPSYGGFGPSSNTWFLGSTKFKNSKGISIGSATFVGLTIVRDRHRPTDRPRYSIYNNRPRPHLRI